MSLRLRLALFIGVLVALAVVVQGLVGYARFERLGLAAADRSLRDFVEQKVRLLPPGRHDRPGHDRPGRLRILDTDPNIRARIRLATAVLEDFGTVFPEIAPTQLGYSTIGAWRVLVLELPMLRRLEVAANLGALRQGQANYLATLFLTVPLLAGLGGVAAWLVSVQALRPLERLIAAQQRVAHSGDLSERVVPPRGSRELETLTTTFNQMLARLQDVKEREIGFTRTAAHELRTPLTVMQAQLDAQKNGWASAEEALQSVQNQVTRMSKLSEGLLILAREGRTERIEFDFGQMLASLAQKYGAHYLGKTRQHWFGNPILLERAVENLLENAQKHAPSTQVNLCLTIFADRAEVSVRDHGRGIKPEELKKVTQAFFRASNTQAYGSGLGLAVVQRIAQAHGGDIRLENASPCGLLVTLIISV
ncbi:MAG: ATP-binding protein [Deinococcales bacterium]